MNFVREAVPGEEALGEQDAWAGGPDRAIVTGMDATDLPDRYAGVEARIPVAWEELQGPSSGVVHLPTRLAWSGLTDFDVADPGDRFALYCPLLGCGQRSDIGRYVSGDLLRQERPRLLRATTRHITRRWEQRLPGLAA